MDAFSSVFAVLMLASGLFMTVRLGGFQFTHLGRSLKAVLFPGKSAQKGGGLTPFEAMASALGGSVGTANIAGTAGAIALGGPGAVFWMWIAGLIGMAVKFSEIVLALRFREKRGGKWIGGPMLYIEKGLGNGRFSKWPAMLFAAFALLCSVVSTPLVQANTVGESIGALFAVFLPKAGGTAAKLFSGGLIALLVGAALLGGAKRIGRISSRVVPFMAVLYIGCCAAALIRFRSGILPALRAVIGSAFGLRPAAGGFAGGAMLAAMRVGTARGVYSNEAGVGSAPMAHACADTDDPVRQGLFGIFEVFTDTLVMCTLTALTVLSSGVPLEGSGMAIAHAAFSALLGAKVAGVFLAASLFLFAYTSILGWSFYGLSCARYLFGERAVPAVCAVTTALCAVGVFVRTDAVWRLGECLNYLMACPNMLAVLLLSGVVVREARDYSAMEGQRKTPPAFCRRGD